MARIYLVRHGRAAASFAEDLDPGLDELGRQQAEAACGELAARLPLALTSSPLKRATETAQPLRQQSGVEIQIDDRVAEIPSPGLSLEERGPWLREVMQGKWAEQSATLQQWQQNLIEFLVGIESDTAIFSHFVAINAAVGAAQDDDRVLIFRPDNGSITTLETDGQTLRLVERGREGETKVN